jgi:putative peptidoglycan lipid II flippase
VYYARRDLITPAKTATVSLIANIILNFIFFHFTDLKQGGLALATSIAATLNTILLYVLVIKRYGHILDRQCGITLLKTVIVSFLMGGVAWYSYNAFSTFLVSESFLARALATLSGVGAGTLTFVIIAYIVRLDILSDIIHSITKRKSRE